MLLCLYHLKAVASLISCLACSCCCCLCFAYSPQPLGPSTDPQLVEAKHLVSRKQQQLGHLEAYDEAIVALKAKVKEAEGQDMREAIQDKVGSKLG